MTARSAVTIGLWVVALGALAVGGLVTAAFVAMPMSLDPAELMTAGAEPWTDALYAALAFIGLIAVTALGVALWHTRRFRPIGAILVVIAAGGVATICVKVYEDYF